MDENNLTSSWWLSGADDGDDGRPADLDNRLRLGRFAKLQTKARQACSDHLPVPIAGDPAFNMLLVLYSAYAEQQTLKVTALVFSSGVPDTTGLRWLDALSQKGLVRREPVVNDRRSSQVQLTNEGVRTMERLLRRQLQIFTKDGAL